jgi:type I restriction enzyme, S subunit
MNTNGHTLNFLEKLLDGAEVEWVALGEVAAYSKSRIGFKELDPASYVGVDNLLPEKAGKTNSSYVPTQGNLTKYYANDILIGNIRPYLKKIWLADRLGGTNGDVLVIRPTDGVLSPRYLYQVLSSDAFFDYNMQHSKGAKMPRGDKSKIMEYSFPIPCPGDPEKSLAIQAEIVRILDTFTELTTELTTELAARKKQYNHYRDQLLSFEEGDVEWKTLDEVASFRRGSFPQPYGNSEWYDGKGDMPFVQVADVADFGFVLHKNTKQRISRLAQPKSVFVKTGTVIVSLQGTIGRVAITQYDCFVDRTLAIFTSYKEEINKKYFAHQLRAKFEKEKEYARGSTLKTITKEEFSKFQIPIPPLAEQVRIVAILDKFDTLTHSISEGLPREIELRQKQYEYYRDMLLNFPKSETRTEAKA